jgi:hypothetical protein
MKATKEFKRTVKTQLDKLAIRLKELQQQMSNNNDIEFDKENVRQQPQEYKPIDVSYGSGPEIHSKEYTNSGEDYEYGPDSINDPKI